MDRSTPATNSESKRREGGLEPGKTSSWFSPGNQLAEKPRPETAGHSPFHRPGLVDRTHPIEAHQVPPGSSRERTDRVATCFESVARASHLPFPAHHPSPQNKAADSSPSVTQHARDTKRDGPASTFTPTGRDGTNQRRQQ